MCATIAIASCILFTVAVAVPSLSVDNFNAWLNDGLKKGASSVDARLTRTQSVLRPLRLDILHTDASLSSAPLLSLPLKSHTLSSAFIADRSYATLLRERSPKKRPLSYALHELTLALLVEMALEERSPIAPWCRLLLQEPRGIGVSIPPPLWHRSLVDDIQPRLLRDELQQKRREIDDEFEKEPTQRMLSALGRLAEEALGRRPGFNISSQGNYARARAYISASSFIVMGKGLLVIPIANFFDSATPVDFAAGDSYHMAAEQKPFVRRLSQGSSFVENDVWSLAPESPSVHADEQTAREVDAAPVVELQHPVTPEEHFLGLGRLPVRSAWEATDCQLIIFSHRLSRERNQAKAEVAEALEHFVRHYSCLREGQVPYHGLIGALISVLPSATPSSVTACIKTSLQRTLPLDEERVQETYSSFVSCIKAATWQNDDDVLQILSNHKAALVESIKSYEREQIQVSATLDSDKAQLINASSAEAEALWKLRIHRRDIFQKLPSIIEPLGVEDDRIEL